MNLNYIYCRNPIQNKEWSSKVIYKNNFDKLQDMSISMNLIDIDKEEKRLQDYFCNVL